jgi:hypothetical protein
MRPAVECKMEKVKIDNVTGLLYNTFLFTLNLPDLFKD